MISEAALRSLMILRGVSQSDLARLSGVSRQAVSLWFRSSRGGYVEVHGRTFLNLCRGLRVRPDDLAEPWPLSNVGTRADETAALLWDRLYPDLERFCAAVLRLEPKALGRLVDVYGLYGAAKVAGDSVWTRFPTYARFLHPAQRDGLERLWRMRTGRVSS